MPFRFRVDDVIRAENLIAEKKPDANKKQIKRLIVDAIESIQANPNIVDESVSDVENFLCDIVLKYMQSGHADNTTFSKEYNKRLQKYSDLKHSHDSTFVLDKHMILNNNTDGLLTISDELHFKMDPSVRVKNILISHLTITSNTRLKDPYMYVNCEQISKNVISRPDGSQMTCGACMFLCSEVKISEDTYVYQYQNVHKDHINLRENKLTIDISKLQFKLRSESQDWMRIHDDIEIKTYSVNNGAENDEYSCELADTNAINVFSLHSEVLLSDTVSYVKAYVKAVLPNEIVFSTAARKEKINLKIVKFMRKSIVLFLSHD